MNSDTRRQKRFHSRINVWLAATLTTGAAMATSSAGAWATTYYVSPKAVHSQLDRPTGLDWKHAFPELNAIAWKVIKPGDVIKIDGGLSYMDYNTPLTIGVDGVKVEIPNGSDPINDRGHTGFVNINGNNKIPTLINIGNHVGVTIQGNYGPAGTGVWNTLRIYGYTQNGIAVGPLASNITLNNILLHGSQQQDLIPLGKSTVGNLTGIKIEGGTVTVQQLESRYNTNAIALTPGARGIFRHCWFHADANSGRSDMHRRGLMLFGGGKGQAVVANGCIFGPGLSSGVRIDQDGASVAISDSGFINPQFSNDRMVNTTPAGNTRFVIDHCTSFLTPFNSLGEGHNCLLLKNASYSVSNSVFFGGVVEALPLMDPPPQKNNFQFKTSGKTYLLGFGQTPFNFQYFDANKVANRTPADELQRLNLTLPATSAPALAQAGIRDSAALSGNNLLRSHIVDLSLRGPLMP